MLRAKLTINFEIAKKSAHYFAAVESLLLQLVYNVMGKFQHYGLYAAAILFVGFAHCNEQHGEGAALFIPTRIIRDDAEGGVVNLFHRTADDFLNSEVMSEVDAFHYPFFEVQRHGIVVVAYKALLAIEGLSGGVGSAAVNLYEPH